VCCSSSVGLCARCSASLRSRYRHRPTPERFPGPASDHPRSHRAGSALAPRLPHRGRAHGACNAPRTRRAALWPGCSAEGLALAGPPRYGQSAQRLIQRRRWAAPAASWAARPRSCPPWARQRARTDAAPCLTHPPPKGPGGRHRLRCAPPVLLLPVTPNPLQGGCAGERYACGGSPCSRCRLLRRLPRAARGALSPLPAPRPPGAVPVLALQPGTASARCGRGQRPICPPGGAQEAGNPSPARRRESLAARRAPSVKAKPYGWRAKCTRASLDSARRAAGLWPPPGRKTGWGKATAGTGGAPGGRGAAPGLAPLQVARRRRADASPRALSRGRRQQRPGAGSRGDGRAGAALPWTRRLPG